MGGNEMKASEARELANGAAERQKKRAYQAKLKQVKRDEEQVDRLVAENLPIMYKAIKDAALEGEKATSIVMNDNSTVYNRAAYKIGLYLEKDGYKFSVRQEDGRGDWFDTTTLTARWDK